MRFGWNPFRKKCKLRIKPSEYYDNDLTRFLEKGDVLLYRGQFKNFLSALIMEFTNSPYAHADIYVGDGWSISAESYGITLNDHCNSEFIDVMRLKGGLSRENRGIILEKAYQSLAKPYEYFGLLVFPFGTEKAAAERSANAAYFCSELVAWCYSEAKIDLIEGKPEAIEAPADLAHSDKLEWLGSWRNGQPFDEAKMHEFHKFQLNKKGGFAKWLINKIVDKISGRDEYYDKLRDGHFAGTREKHYKKMNKAYAESRDHSIKALLDSADSP